MGNIPLPSGIDAAQRRFRAIQAAVDNTGTRTLEAATISQGNLRVRHGGNIIIGDGGALHITGGDLILGKGKIQGDALAEQFTAKNIDKPLRSVSGGLGTSWRALVSETVSPPAWAQKTLIFATYYATCRFNYSGGSLETPNIQGRITAAGKASEGLEFNWAWGSWGGDSILRSGSGVAIFEIPGGAAFTLSMEGKASKSASPQIEAQLKAMCIFTRNNS